MKKCAVISVSVITTIGILIVVAAVTLIFESNNIIRRVVNQQVVLKNGSEAYKAWKDPPVDVFMQFWVFDLQNKDAVLDGTEKPNVTQKGPYTYREVRNKQDVQFLQNGALLSYKEPKAYVFERELSIGPSDDNFTSINLPILTIAALLGQKSSIPGFLKDLIAKLLVFEEEHLFEQHSVHEFLWGYEEPLLSRINAITKKFGFGFNTTVGLFTGPTSNGSDDGIYDIFSGTEDLQKLNIVDMWKNSSTLPYWTTPYCNMINGTDGSKWHPYIKQSERLYIFSSDICRSIYLEFINSSVVHGIPTYHFVPPPEVFMDHVHNPANEGFCVPDCLESGVLDMMACKSGAPIIVSQPHFYQGSPRYINAITGMHPEAQYSTYVDVEPISGVAMNVAKKLQLNAKITRLRAFKDTAIFNMTIFPMLWLNESAQVSSAAAKEFSDELFWPINMLKAIRYGLLALGCVILVIVIIYVVQYKVRASTLHIQDPPLLRGDI